MDKNKQRKQRKSDMTRGKSIKPIGAPSERTSDRKETSVADRGRTNGNNGLKKRRPQAAQEL